MQHIGRPHAREGWAAANRDGLTLAAEGRWTEALAQFDRALASLAGVASVDAESAHNRERPQAVVLSNIVQALCRRGDVAAARACAERNCALRVTHFGEHSLAAARARNDLAVIVATGGDTRLARHLVETAIDAVEQAEGHASAFLVPLLRNAAALAHAADDRATARALARRLETLLHASGQPTVQATALLRGLDDADARAEPPRNAMDLPEHDTEQSLPHAREFTTARPTPIPAGTFQTGLLASSTDDLPLRVAIAETGELLRNTPPRVPVVHERPVATPSRSFEQPTAREPDGSVLESLHFDLVDDPATPAPEPVPAARAPDAAARSLGFEVEHGIPADLLEPLPDQARNSGATSTEAHVVEPTPDAAPAARAEERHAMRAVGGPRRGRAQVVDARRLRYVWVGTAAFAAGAAVAYWLLPLVRQP